MQKGAGNVSGVGAVHGSHKKRTQTADTIIKNTSRISITTVLNILMTALGLRV